MINTDILTPPAAGEAEEASRLHATLVAAAADRNLLDVAYRTVDSPFGPLLLAATEQGLVRLAYAARGARRGAAEPGRAHQSAGAARAGSAGAGRP